MKKKLIIIILIVIFLGGAAFYFFHPSQKFTKEQLAIPYKSYLGATKIGEKNDFIKNTIKSQLSQDSSRKKIGAFNGRDIYCYEHEGYFTSGLYQLVDVPIEPEYVASNGKISYVPSIEKGTAAGFDSKDGLHGIYYCVKGKVNTSELKMSFINFDDGKTYQPDEELTEKPIFENGVSKWLVVYRLPTSDKIDRQVNGISELKLNGEKFTNKVTKKDS
jgi:uncharacterized protein YxeA